MVNKGRQAQWVTSFISWTENFDALRLGYFLEKSGKKNIRSKFSKSAIAFAKRQNDQNTWKENQYLLEHVFFGLRRIFPHLHK